MSQQDVLDCLRQQLQAEGLLTAEQREALEYAIDNVDPCPIVYIDAIRDLLSGAGVCRSKQTWEATEERRAALDAFSTILTVIGCVPCHSYICTHFIKHIKVLRAMLEEVGQK